MRELERLAGLSNGQLRRLLNGERPGLEAKGLSGAAKALQAPSEWLLEGKGIAPRPTGDVPPWPGGEK